MARGRALLPLLVRVCASPERTHAPPPLPPGGEEEEEDRRSIRFHLSSRCHESEFRLGIPSKSPQEFSVAEAKIRRKLFLS